MCNLYSLYTLNSIYPPHELAYASKQPPTMGASTRRQQLDQEQRRAPFEIPTR